MKPQHETVLIVQCVKCKATRELRESDGPHNDIPLCEKDGMPMLAKRATTRPIKTLGDCPK